MEPIEFFVKGTPVGKARPRFARRGAFVTAYTPKKSADFEALVADAARQVMRTSPPLPGAVRVIIRAWFEPPKSWTKAEKQAAIDGRRHHTSKPDADNLAKSVLDAVNGIIVVDDAQVVELTIAKRYAGGAGCYVTVEEL